MTREYLKLMTVGILVATAMGAGDLAWGGPPKLPTRQAPPAPNKLSQAQEAQEAHVHRQRVNPLARSANPQIQHEHNINQNMQRKAPPVTEEMMNGKRTVFKP